MVINDGESDDCGSDFFAAEKFLLKLEQILRSCLPVKQLLSKGKVSDCHCRRVPNKKADQLRQNKNKNALIENIDVYGTKIQGVFIGPRYTWGPIYGSECL